jgi:uncharacterized OB-fold protein
MGKQLPLVDYLVLDDGDPYLMANACRSCGASYFDRRNACARCSATEFDRKPLGRTGIVRAFTIVQRAAPGVPAPYVSAVIDLDGGGVVKSNLVDVEADPDHVRLGMPVRMTTFVAGTDDDGTEAVAFGFTPAGQP